MDTLHDKVEKQSAFSFKSPQELVSHLEKLMDEGNYAACFDLGQLYYQGDNGVHRDVLLAISYFNPTLTSYFA